MSYEREYKRWVEDFASDPEIYEELKSIADSPKAIEDRFFKELEFGTAGMRGVLGAGINRMNTYTVRRVTRALAEYICTIPEAADRGVAIGYDSRHKSTEFALDAAMVLAAAGVKSYLYDELCPVPVLSFTVRKLNCIAGIMITASHNPAQYNGYKVYWSDGAQMPPDSVKAITDKLPGIAYAGIAAMDEAEARAKGLINHVPDAVMDSYIEMVKGLSINPELAREMGDKLKIVYTPLHGAGNVPVRRVLRELGYKNVYVVPEQEKPDGDFPTVRVPNPEEKDAFALAVEMQRRLGADLCVGSDPDCDRVGIACLLSDGEVKLLNGNQIGCVLLHYILSQKKELGTLPDNAAVVVSIVSTDMAKAICDEFGVKFIKVLTGFKYIGEQIELFKTTGSNTFMFGFEESYGYLSGTEVRDKDGVNACMLIAEAAAYYKKRGMTLADAIEELYERYGFYGDKVTSYVLPGKDGLGKIKTVMKQVRDNPPAKFGNAKVVAVRDYLTGIRTSAGAEEKLTLPKSDVVFFELEDNSWVCVRPSGTEPKVKLYINAVSSSHCDTEKKLEDYAATAVALLDAAK